MTEFYVVSALLFVSFLQNAYAVVYVLRHFSKENGKLQAAAFARKSDPVTAAVYQTYNPSDERSPEMMLEDYSGDQSMKPLGL